MAKPGIFSSLICAALLVAPAAHAEQFVTSGQYQAHYSAFRADFITPEVARANDITRSTQRGLVNITVLKRQADNSYAPAEATVVMTVENLIGQKQAIVPRAIREPGALYYLGDFDISGTDTYRFAVTIKPADGGREFSLRFNQELVAD